MAFYNDEYKHILLAERVMAGVLKRKRLKVNEAAIAVKALIDAVILKRKMRLEPDPKPIDVDPKLTREERRIASSNAPLVIDVAPANATSVNLNATAVAITPIAAVPNASASANALPGAPSIDAPVA